MQIYLIRHGKSQHTGKARISGDELGRWAEAYDNSGIIPGEIPSRTREQIAGVTCMVSSDLPRALETARALAPAGALISDPLFREAELHVPAALPGRIRLPGSVWALLIRGLWLTRLALGCSSARTAHARLRDRAQRAAQMLIRLAEQDGAVVLVGHGYFNTLIARELRSRGWAGPHWPNPRHWGCTAYARTPD